jgi:hypothetical protein
MRRRLRVDWRVLAVGAVCAVALVALAAALYWPSGGQKLPPYSRPGPPTGTVVVEGVDLILDYQTSNVSDTSYFMPPECDACPFDETPGGQWNFQFELTNNDSLAHEVSGVTVESPFDLVSIDPSMPAHFAPGASAYIELTIQLPTTPDYYFLTGAIVTS